MTSRNFLGFCYVSACCTTSSTKSSATTCSRSKTEWQSGIESFFFLWSYWIFFCFLKIFFRHHQIIKISFSSFFPPQKINIFRQINKHINVRCIWEAVAGCKSHKFGVEAFVCVGRQLQIIFETKQTSYILQIFFFCFFCFLKTKSTKFFSQKSLSASCFFFIWLSCSVFAEVNWLHT